MMRFFLRRDSTATSSDPIVESQKIDEAAEALAEAKNALGHVRVQKQHGSLIANTLKQIRQENHFQEIWNDGMEGG
jgi:hypothetical protein